MLFLLVGRDGFEPSKTESSDLQSDAVGHFAIYPYKFIAHRRVCYKLFVELVNGIEPSTYWLQINCSACWATPAFVFPWCLGAESNHRHRDFQSLALPAELPRHMCCGSRIHYCHYTLATRRGLEPLTSSVTGWRTNQLYYRAKIFFWWAFRDSNPGPIGYEPTALTNWAKGPCA